MAWFLALQGPTHTTSQSSVFELHDSADVEKIAQELVSAVILDRVVSVPTVLRHSPSRHQTVLLYVRPAAWGAWTFYELSEEDRLKLLQGNPLLNALSKAAQQRGQATAPTGQSNPLTRGTPTGNPGSLGPRQ